MEEASRPIRARSPTSGQADRCHLPGEPLTCARRAPSRTVSGVAPRTGGGVAGRGVRWGVRPLDAWAVVCQRRPVQDGLQAGSSWRRDGSVRLVVGRRGGRELERGQPCHRLQGLQEQDIGELRERRQRDDTLLDVGGTDIRELHLQGDHERRRPLDEHKVERDLARPDDRNHTGKLLVNPRGRAPHKYLAGSEARMGWEEP